MTVKKIVLKNLFGLFDHEIDLRVDERITIIHGPNGVGKTTILQLLNDLFERRFHSLRTTPYESLLVHFSDGVALEVTRSESQDDNELPLLRFICRRPGADVDEYDLRVSEEWDEIRRHIPLGAIDEFIEPLDRVARTKWFDASIGDTLSLEEVFSRYAPDLPFPEAVEFYGLPKWLLSCLDSVSTYFIQTQRLFAVPAPSAGGEWRRVSRREATGRERQSAVRKYAGDMVDRIRDALRESGARAASLDRTFPQRLLSGSLPTEATEDAIRDRYEEQAEYRRRLMNAGLIEMNPLLDLPAGELKNHDRKVLWYYLQDVEEKLEAFQGLLEKVELFRDIINSRFLYKSFNVDKEEGFAVTAQNSRSIPLDALSSGEQHELVLAYALLFAVKPKSLILIDEPELSLHVTWQHKFLDDVKRISDLADLDFLIATHSPSIIHDRTDLMVGLGDVQA